MDEFFCTFTPSRGKWIVNPILTEIVTISFDIGDQYCPGISTEPPTGYKPVGGSVHVYFSPGRVGSGIPGFVGIRSGASASIAA